MNPFDDPDGSFVLVGDDDGHLALWPTFAPPVEGWETVFGPASRQDCLDRVEEVDELNQLDRAS
ncbi:MbtH family NRPS accessory protein [Luteococcus japonicus]|uniref:MbtH-like domain-containing protein n=1 Tax=Luteococcus japonicus LSP_Lj1 TaxID=1255658 RepID=A0A1R4KGA7_9ACTN|nr:MbtH family NRPS accessory protein [Luteococcus japonicus]SJN43255.1 hypothetical protein FM114_14140 [Luteococcus japonicus LSP_Lj1]